MLDDLVSISMHTWGSGEYRRQDGVCGIVSK